MEKMLGKIQTAKFGIGGYQDAMIGIHFSIGGDGWGVCDSRCAWDANKIKWTEHCKWTEEGRGKNYEEIVRYISDLLKDAKVSEVSKLVGIPIEAEFEGNTLKSWRILTEVL